MTKNAASKGQVKEAEQKERRGLERDRDDLRHVLSSVQGRRFIWRLMAECRTYNSVWDPSSKIHYLSGKQDVGHFLMAEVCEANQEAYFQMMREAKEGVYKNG